MYKEICFYSPSPFLADLPVFPVFLFNTERFRYSCWLFEGIYLFLMGRGASVCCQPVKSPSASVMPLETAQVTTRPSLVSSASAMCVSCHMLPWVMADTEQVYAVAVDHLEGRSVAKQRHTFFLIYKTTCFQEDPGALWLLLWLFLFSVELCVQREFGLLIELTNLILLLLDGWHRAKMSATQ